MTFSEASAKEGSVQLPVCRIEKGLKTRHYNRGL